MAAENTKSSAVDQDQAVRQLDGQELGDVSGGAWARSDATGSKLAADYSDANSKVTEEAAGATIYYTTEAAAKKSNTYGTYLDDIEVESCK